MWANEYRIWKVSDESIAVYGGNDVNDRIHHPAIEMTRKRRILGTAE